MVAVVALIGVLFAAEVNGASRWLHVGPLGVQPSELAKLAIILFTAALLERRMDRIDDVCRMRCCRLGSTTGLIVALILLEPDLGTAVSVLVIASAMIFAAGISYKYVLGIALAAVPALYVVVIAQRLPRAAHQGFLDPWSDPQGAGYQVIQSMIAVGTGGVLGTGLMGGMQKLFYLPEAHNDFIYAVIAEEFGLIGATTVLLCFGVITWRGLRTATRAPDRFGAFLAVGLTTMIAFQALLNISVVTGSRRPRASRCRLSAPAVRRCSSI